ncbi:hypothetical protein ACS2QU_11020 [Bacillus cereus group sp. Bce005]|uniref:hypothetical protein n=1 Tax=Bacillus TaxID=1386 RepID=UPI000BF6B122|nr:MULTISPECIES: hypothetical protein [Bacillus cereus group]MDA1601104.1 hypothetical protein [Bacillus cereus]PFR52260.1 hypothetical protein COK35_04355 [Bacillus cereus]PGC14183.1 hypothetical protein COM08_25395 [Bacillus wiedmannii]
MGTPNESFLSVLGRLSISFEVILFSITTLIIFLISTYFYNHKFPNHRYPAFLEFLSYIA